MLVVVIEVIKKINDMGVKVVEVVIKINDRVVMATELGGQ